MSTTSTKSRRKKEGPAIPQNGTSKFEPAEPDKRSWLISSAAILIVGAFLRLYDLSLVPLHHDEGVNGNFLVTLVRNGTYQYDPQNYHGPTLYYFSAIVPWLCRFFGGKSFGDAYGLTTFNIRLFTAAFGVATIWLALLLRKRLGAISALSAAALIAISPGAVYLSRYFIHEPLFVFFTFGIVVAALKYYDSGSAVYLILAAISAALMVATKETWIINTPVLLIALLTTNVYFWLREKLSGKTSKEAAAGGSLGDRVQKALERFGGPVSVATVVLVAFALFLIVNVFFYSSFFTNYPKGVHDAISTLNLWSHRTHEHEHPWWQYGYWLAQEELPLLLLGTLGALIAVWRATNRLAVFLALWSFGSLAAYSLVGYKTPWITLNFIVPLALTSGYTLDFAYEKLREFEQPRLFIALAVLIAAVCGYQTISLNFVHYDDDAYPYVYAHTKRETLALVDEVDRIARRLGTGNETGVAIVSPDYWPLPWYFRDYKRVGYYQQIVPTNEPIIIGSTAKAEELRATYGDRYELVKSGLASDGSYALRPGVDLLLYVKRDMAR